MTATPRTRWGHVDPVTREEVSSPSRPIDCPSILVRVVVSGRDFIEESCETVDRDGISRPPPGYGWIAAGAKPKAGTSRWLRRRSL